MFLRDTEVRSPDVEKLDLALFNTGYRAYSKLTIGRTSYLAQPILQAQLLVSCTLSGSSSPAPMWPQSTLLRIAEHPKDDKDPSYLLYLFKASS